MQRYHLIGTYLREVCPLVTAHFKFGWLRERDLVMNTHFERLIIPASQELLEWVGRCKWPNWISYVATGERTFSGNST